MRNKVAGTGKKENLKVQLYDNIPFMDADGNK
jgi:hypothetical protein